MTGFFVLGFFMIVVGIPVIGGIWASNEKEKMKLRRVELEVLGPRSTEQAARQSERVEWLEERMRVLEQIVTDKGFSLASEIDGLRDRPAAVRDMRPDREESRS